MIAWHECGRHCGLVAIAIALATIALRPQISSALVTRGDELTYRGDAAHSRDMYARALLADPRNEVAADRYAFSAMMSHRMPLLLAGIEELDRALARDPGNLALQMDRALCEQGAHRLAAAARDFATVATHTHDPRAFTFAALDVASTDRHRARAYLTQALRYDPGFEPARRDLHRFMGKQS